MPRIKVNDLQLWRRDKIAKHRIPYNRNVNNSACVTNESINNFSELYIDQMQSILLISFVVSVIFLSFSSFHLIAIFLHLFLLTKCEWAWEINQNERRKEIQPKTLKYEWYQVEWIIFGNILPNYMIHMILNKAYKMKALPRLVLLCHKNKVGKKERYFWNDAHNARMTLSSYFMH